MGMKVAKFGGSSLASAAQFRKVRDILLMDPIETWKKTRMKAGTFTLREVLVPVFKNGTCVFEDEATTMEIRARAQKELDTLWEESKRFVNPHQMYVDLSDRLFTIKSQLLDQMSAE